MKSKPKKHERKTKGQKIPKSKRGKVKNPVRPKPASRTKTKRGKVAKRKEPAKKVVSNRKVSATKKQTPISKRTSRKNTPKSRPESLTIGKRKRGKEIINVGFGKIRKVETKISAFETSEKLNKEITKQLKRKGGRPPKGVVIVVRDKNGNEAAHVTRPSFVANKKNIEKELQKFTKDLKKDFSKSKTQLAKGKQPKITDTGYEDYNPDNIQEIEIKFLY